MLDDLTYDYSTDSNKLLEVNDNNASQTNPIDFKDKNSGNDYTYYPDGNLKSDLNKEITLIKYNYSNMPTEITFAGGDKINYIYDANGVKLKKITTSGIDILYINGVVYDKGDDGYTMSRYPIANGYLSNNNGKFVKTYQITDQVGNTRVSIRKGENGLEILNQEDYYPFGLQHKWNSTYLSENTYAEKWKFNGKEFQDEFGLDMYDYGARHYDASLGRWFVPDPMAESYYSQSTYHFSGNNPILYIDKNGMNYNPIYDEYGDFMGTDDWGLQGDAIFMNSDFFYQGMSHYDAMYYDFGYDALNHDAYSNYENHFAGLEFRPDYDGKITLSEANAWFRNGNNEPLFADMSQIDLGFVSASTFDKIGDFNGVQTLFNSEDGFVYGHIGLTYEGNQRVSSKYDTYDFNRHNIRSTAPLIKDRIWGNMKRGFRNFATVVGRIYANQHPINNHNPGYKIHFYGTSKISK